MKIKSISDVITNSSSEVFICNSQTTNEENFQMSDEELNALYLLERQAMYEAEQELQDYD